MHIQQTFPHPSLAESLPRVLPPPPPGEGARPDRREGSRTDAPKPWSTTLLALLTIITTMLTAGGCSTVRPVPDPASGSLDLTELAAAIEAGNRGAASVRGFARIEAYSPRGRVKLDQLIVARAPHMLRIETLTPFDQPLSWLTSDGTTFNLYSLEEKKFYTGAATQSNLAHILPVKLPPPALIKLILGGVPTMAAIPTGEPRRERGKGEWILNYRFQDGEEVLHQEVRVDPATMQIMETSVFEGADQPDGRRTPLYTLKYGQRKKAGDHHHFPHKVRILIPGDKLDITFQWRDIELDQTIPDSAWTLEQPRGVPVITLTQ